MCMFMICVGPCALVKKAVYVLRQNDRIACPQRSPCVDGGRIDLSGQSSSKFYPSYFWIVSKHIQTTYGQLTISRWVSLGFLVGVPILSHRFGGYLLYWNICKAMASCCPRWAMHIGIVSDSINPNLIITQPSCIIMYHMFPDAWLLKMVQDPLDDDQIWLNHHYPTSSNIVGYITHPVIISRLYTYIHIYTVVFLS